MASRSTPPAARPDRRTLDGVWSQRSVIDYGLARRATLTSLLGAGAVTREDACDAHPYLLLAARHHGEPTGRECPVCRAELLLEVSYVYGDQLGRYQGRVKGRAELAEMAMSTASSACTSSRWAAAAAGTIWSAPTSWVTESTGGWPVGREGPRTPVRRTAWRGNPPPSLR
jgi:hypothetical protein